MIRLSSSTGDELSPRQQEIVRCLVGSYIGTAQPISSGYLASRFSFGVSPATIRSDFVDLEEKGYLISLHRSSGRIPTEKSYRFYVLGLTNEWLVDEADQTFIQQELLRHPLQLHEILKATAQLLSMLSSYSAVVLSPRLQMTVLKHFELIDMGQDEVMVLMITRSGLVLHHSVVLDQHLPRSVLQQFSRFLNHSFAGADLEEMRQKMDGLMAMNEAFRPFKDTISRALHGSLDAFGRKNDTYAYGQENLLYQLMSSGQVDRESVTVFDQNFLQDTLQQSMQVDDILVMIDGDADRRMQGLSMILKSYKMGEKQIGALGLIGPNRMDYVRMIGLVNYMSRLLSSLITRISN
ncbi:MAG: heat-inducible transcription repressor HrcA [Spirochaetales bacterium]|nr:heat-inducible transcription repressor HrcA [Spirochaetales bacterium]